MAVGFILLRLREFGSPTAAINAVLGLHNFLVLFDLDRFAHAAGAPTQREGARGTAVCAVPEILQRGDSEPAERVAASADPSGHQLVPEDGLAPMPLASALLPGVFD